MGKNFLYDENDETARASPPFLKKALVLRLPIHV
jgi:hypothetical protein